MRWSEREWDHGVEEQYPDRVLVRAFKDCTVWAAELEQPLLVLVEDATHRVAVFEYDSREERERDVQRIQRMPEEDGDADSGVPAGPGPVPPDPSSESEERPGR